MVSHEHNSKSETEELRMRISEFKRRTRKAIRQIVRSLKNRGFEAYYVEDPHTNMPYAILPLSSLLKVVKRNIDPSIRDFILISYLETEKIVNIEGVPTKVKEPQIVFTIDVEKIEELRREKEKARASGVGKVLPPDVEKIKPGKKVEKGG